MRFKRTTKFISVILSICFVFCSVYGSGFSAMAASTGELNSKKDKIQSQINDAQKKVNELASQKKETQEYITALDKKIQLLQDQIDVLQEDADNLQKNIDKIQQSIVKIEQDIEETQRQIDEKQAQFDKTFNDYCQRLRAMYISGSASNLEVLLTSTDMSSILTRSQMIKSVSEQDSGILDSLMKQMEEIEKDKASLEKKYNELSENKTKLENDKKVLVSNIATIDSSKRELDSEVAECNAMIKKLSDETAEYQETIESNREQLEEVERQIREAYANASRTGSTGGSSGDGSHSGRLGYPTSSRTISAGYPNYSSGRYHGGIDFRCPTGTAVCAAASGTVICAKNLNYSYGHYLIIDHGNGLSTLYAHNSQLLVGVGDHVSKGQQIARSGSTGNSSGPHCHFEVRVNGTRVNPMNYL